MNSKAHFVSKTCFAAGLIEVTRLVTAIYDTALRPAGITVTQFNLLAAISILRPDTISGLATAVGLERSTASRNLSVLTRNGWIERVARGEAGSPDTFQLSPKGIAVFEAAYPLWADAQEEITHQLGESGAVSYRTMVNQVRAALAGAA